MFGLLFQFSLAGNGRDAYVCWDSEGYCIRNAAQNRQRRQGGTFFVPARLCEYIGAEAKLAFEIPLTPFPDPYPPNLMSKFIVDVIPYDCKNP